MWKSKVGNPGSMKKYLIKRWDRAKVNSRFATTEGAVVSAKVTATATNTEAEPTPKKTTFREDFKNFRSGPNFKYWFIGGTFFSSWMAYYGYKTYKNTRIQVDLPPPLPSHFIVTRNKELGELYEHHNKKYVSNKKVTNIMIAGSPASGKTVLTHQFVDLLLRKQNEFMFGIPTSRVSAFLQADSKESFLLSLKKLAAKLKVKPIELEEQVDKERYERFSLAPFAEQCDALFALIQEKLKKHSGWVIVIDDLQSTTPLEINDVIRKWFISDDHAKDWSHGTSISVYDLPPEKVSQWSSSDVYAKKTGLEVRNAQQLLKNIANLDENASKTEEVTQLVTRFFCNPLAIVCVGMLLREKLQTKEVMSIKKAITDLCKEIDDNIRAVQADNSHLEDFIHTNVGMKLVTIETVVTMAINLCINKDQYLYHGFDMIASCKPGLILPQALLTRHLKHPTYKLPHLIQEKDSILDVLGKKDAPEETSKASDSDLDPQGKAWSNKNLANYLKKAEEFFSEIVSAVKLTYNLVYGVLPELPEKRDGLDMFRDCELLLTNNIEPGGAKGVGMHPLVYSAARQHFTGSTIFKLEADHLNESQHVFNNQPWFKKLSAFSEQACLQTYRSSANSNVPVQTQPSQTPITTVLPQTQTPLMSLAHTLLFRYNFGVKSSLLYEQSPFIGRKEDFWLPKVTDVAVYLQNHLGRVIHSICDEISCSKQDTAGTSSKRALMLHLEYILDNQPVELLGHKAHIEGLKALASCYISIGRDIQRGQQLLNNVYNIQINTPGTSQVEIAKTLYQLGEIQNTLENYDEAKRLLEEAVDMYEKDRKKEGAYKEQLDFGKCLALLGVVYGSMEEKKASKETLERALMIQQGGAPDMADEGKSKQFGATFASSLTDLGHSYILLGMPLYGKKILDLALVAHKNLHGDDHPEVVRTLTVLGIAHLMQGHNEESLKLRQEAAKVQRNINALPMY